MIPEREGTSEDVEGSVRHVLSQFFVGSCTDMYSEMAFSKRVLSAFCKVCYMVIKVGEYLQFYASMNH